MLFYRASTVPSCSSGLTLSSNFDQDLIGAQSHDGPEEAVFNDKVEQLAKQVRVTENFRARIERLQFAQQRQSATKPQ